MSKCEKTIDEVEETEYVEDELSRRRETRKRSGRYLALGISIFLLSVGFYHALVYKATKYAALLGTALIMFFYLAWLLYASQPKHKHLVNTPRSVEMTELSTEDCSKHGSNGKISQEVIQEQRTFYRSYSIA